MTDTRCSALIVDGHLSWRCPRPVSDDGLCGKHLAGMRQRERRLDQPQPHLFLARNADGDDALWWGTGPDDRACVELDLSGLRRAGIAPEKAVWDVIRDSYRVEDCTDWQEASGGGERSNRVGCAAQGPLVSAPCIRLAHDDGRHDDGRGVRWIEETCETCGALESTPTVGCEECVERRLERETDRG